MFLCILHDAKKITITLLVSFTLLIACKDASKTNGDSENNIDAAENFIRAALDGKFKDAMNYMLADSANIHSLDENCSLVKKNSSNSKEVL